MYKISERGDENFESLAEAVQEAEFLAMELGKQILVVASEDVPQQYMKGDVVYKSLGAVE